MFDIGVSRSALHWISSYFTDQAEQITNSPSVRSGHALLLRSTQGSVLGPVLFSLYTRAVLSVCSPTPSIQLADDIALHDSNSTAAGVSTSLSAAVSRLSSWLDWRRLILNPTKSKVVAVLPHRQLDGQVLVFCDGTVLPSGTSDSYLCVIIDAKLSWDPTLR